MTKGRHQISPIHANGFTIMNQQSWLPREEIGRCEFCLWRKLQAISNGSFLYNARTQINFSAFCFTQRAPLQRNQPTRGVTRHLISYQKNTQSTSKIIKSSKKLITVPTKCHELGNQISYFKGALRQLLKTNNGSQKLLNWLGNKPYGLHACGSIGWIFLHQSMIFSHGPFNKLRMVYINFSLTTVMFSYTRSACSRHIRLICSAFILIVVAVSVLIISKFYISQWYMPIEN